MISWAQLYRRSSSERNQSASSIAFTYFWGLSFICVLHLTTGLDTLHMHTPTVEIPYTHFPKSIPRSSSDREGLKPGYLSSITKLRLQADGDKPVISNPGFREAWCRENPQRLLLPSLKWLEIDQSHLVQTKPEPFAMKEQDFSIERVPTSPAIEFVNLSSVSIQESELHDLLQPFIKLQHLRVTAQTYSGERYQAGKKSLNRALQKVAKTLRSLQLEVLTSKCRFLATNSCPVRDAVNLDVANYPPDPWLSCLPRLCSLEYLRIDSIYLFEQKEDMRDRQSAGIFPRSLKRLELIEWWDECEVSTHIEDAGDEVYPETLDLIFKNLWRACADGVFPHLKTIVSWRDAFWPWNDDGDRPNQDALPSFRDIGIEFALRLFGT
ncbi:hypothetical protein F4779DRAFT_622072 [Xylariaceae sp. FL0662B]|nr:hypothetical protein F4779DRAFT_622072 [Xylariaceae sp. FL0662B]